VSGGAGDPIDLLRGRLGQTADPARDRGWVGLLAAAWPELDGSEQEAMAPHKLERLEDPVWKPPVLTFTVERHGGTVLGSSRADLQRWRVDLDARRADCQTRGFRQLRARGPAIALEPIAAELAAAVANREDDPRLQWSADRSVVRVLSSKALPAAPKQTTEGRLKRLRPMVEEALAGVGWRRRSQGGEWSGCYERAESNEL
jgi:hypothetical protein